MKDFFITEVVEGVAVPSAQKKFQEMLSHFNGHVIVTIERKKKKRSLNQNAYYWGVIVRYYIQGIKQFWGEDIDSKHAHEDLKRECNYKEKTSEETGEVRKFTLETSKLTTTEFEEYCQRCREFMFNYFGYKVELPHEQAMLNI